MPTGARDGDWQEAAACVRADPDLFFPNSPGGLSFSQITRAKVVCAACPVRRECLEFAIDHDRGDGIWGGTTPKERNSVRRRELRARRASAQLPAT